MNKDLGTDWGGTPRPAPPQAAPRAPIPRLAFTIAEAVEATSISRTLLYEDIASGLLIARKRGTKTIILTENLNAYLAALPAVREVLWPI